MAAADPTKFKLVKNIALPGIFFDVARVPNSSRLYYGSSDFQVYEIDLSAEKPEPQPFAGAGHESYVTGVALANSGLITGSYDGRLIWWDTASRKPVRSIEAHEKWIRGVEVSADGKVVASVADDMVCKVWNAETGELQHTLAEHNPQTPHNYPSMLYACGFSPDGTLLATADKTGRVIIWETATGQKVGEVEAPVMYTWDPKQRRHSIGGIRSVAFSPDQQQLAVGGIGTIGNIDHLGGPSRIEIFDWKAGKRIHEISDEKFKGLVERMIFHPAGAWFVAAGGDHNGFISFYDAATGKLLHQDKAPMHVHSLVADEDLRTLFGVGHGRIATWELQA